SPAFILRPVGTEIAYVADCVHEAAERFGSDSASPVAQIERLNMPKSKRDLGPVDDNRDELLTVESELGFGPYPLRFCSGCRPDHKYGARVVQGCEDLIAPSVADADLNVAPQRQAAAPQGFIQPFNGVQILTCIGDEHVVLHGAPGGGWF